MGRRSRCGPCCLGKVAHVSILKTSLWADILHALAFIVFRQAYTAREILGHQIWKMPQNYCRREIDKNAPGDGVTLKICLRRLVGAGPHT